jgi:threonine dehydrogenase-like Zn-dependent dehydrogenase
MRALVLSEYKHLDLREVPEPALGDDDVLVRVRACGICGSDVHGYDGSSGRRLPPAVMGHEAAGVVERVGPAVTRWSRGDRVTFDSTVSGRRYTMRSGTATSSANAPSRRYSPQETPSTLRLSHRFDRPARQ